MAFASLLVVVGVHELCQQFTRMAAGIEVIAVLASLPLAAVLTAVSRENVLVLIVIVVFVLVKVGFRHFYQNFLAMFYYSAEI